MQRSRACLFSQRLQGRHNWSDSGVGTLGPTLGEGAGATGAAAPGRHAAGAFVSAGPSSNAVCRWPRGSPFLLLSHVPPAGASPPRRAPSGVAAAAARHSDPRSALGAAAGGAARLPEARLSEGGGSSAGRSGGGASTGSLGGEDSQTETSCQAVQDSSGESEGLLDLLALCDAGEMVHGFGSEEGQREGS